MIRLPSAGRGRRSVERQAEYDAEVRAFADAVKEIRSRLDFAPSARGWCYLLEEHGVTKGEFGRVQALITDCRKCGLLPLGITAEDESRSAGCVQSIDDEEPEDFATGWLQYALDAARRYCPVDFWAFQGSYVQMMVEKIDLKSLFEPECHRFHVPLVNAKGWSDLHSRAAMMRRFRAYEAAGKQCVLLYCGDHDPGGLNIGDALRSNFEELSSAVGWRPDRLHIERFGLNADFIAEHRLPWVDNLETSSGRRLDDPKHPDHSKPYVQQYLRRFGARKVEANALVVRPEAGRRLCRDALAEYIDQGGVDAFYDALEAARAECQSIMPAVARRLAGVEEQP